MDILRAARRSAADIVVIGVIYKNNEKFYRVAQNSIMMVQWTISETTKRREGKSGIGSQFIATYLGAK